MTKQLDLEDWIVENKSQTDLEDWLAAKPSHKAAHPAQGEPEPERKAGELVTCLQGQFKMLTLLSRLMERELTPKQRASFELIGARRVLAVHDEIYTHYLDAKTAIYEDRLWDAQLAIRKAADVINEVHEHIDHYRAQLRRGVKPAQLAHLLHADVRAMTAHVPF